jgi:hypothetical protein
MHNAKVSGRPRSLHLIRGTGCCCAVDLAATDGQYKAKLITLALAQEWSVSVASNFIHLDQRSRYCGLPQIVYHYGR